MSLFPFMNTEDTTPETNVQSRIYKDFDFDFVKGVLTGKKVEGKDALKVWIYKAIKTKRYIHDVYTWDYGNDIEEIIGQGYDKGFIDSEVERRIKDCLMVNEKIKSCHDFNIELSNDHLTVNFKVESVYGEVNISV